MYNKEFIKFKLLKKMYKKDIEYILKANNINMPISEKDNLMISQYVHTLNPHTSTWVVGGACIDRCDGNIKELAICFYYDILMPINFAIEHKLPVAIYIDTPIEVYCKNKGEYIKWINLTKEIITFISNLSKELDKNIYIIRRDKGYKILDNILLNYNFNDKKLKGLYDLVPSKKNNCFNTDLLLHFRRSICQYLPEYLESYFHKKVNKVIVVEEASQLKAILKAKEINEDIIPQVYLDMPSTTCKNRMHRSPSGKIKIFDDIESITADALFTQFINKIYLKSIYKAFSTSDFFTLSNELKKEWKQDDIYN